MLFPSQVFILLFLPATLVAFHVCAGGRTARLSILLLASFAFYAWWDVRFVPLLMTLIAFNWCVVRWHARTRRPWLLSAGIVLNLAVLGCFKYANFFAEAALSLFKVPFEPWSIVLPLGISFFTFQQISYLADVRRGQAPTYKLLDYAAYVSFFPQLIAGPIVRHNELIPQFASKLNARIDAECIARGLVLFILGLAKKVFFADELAPLADAGFGAAATLPGPDTVLAWQSALAYSLQLYFDFSSYSDMAIGLAALFGFDLPINFDRPYRATSIREFWRRWHMTLSRFLLDYVYIPLGGSRRVGLTFVTVLATMLLCGLWHGAGWTFIAWGGFHGLAVCVNRGWNKYGWRLPSLLGCGLTLLFVILGWVLFRAESFEIAQRVMLAMFEMGGGEFDDEAWVMLGVGWLFALAGPTNVELSRRTWIKRRAVAGVLAFLLVAVCLRVGQGRGLEFIYFQF